MVKRWTPRPPITPTQVAHEQLRHECPADFLESIENRQATQALAGTSSVATQARILAQGAKSGAVDPYNPLLVGDIAAHLGGDADRASELVTLSRYSSLGKGVIGSTERWLRRTISPTIRQAINNGTIER